MWRDRFDPLIENFRRANAVLNHATQHGCTPDYLATCQKKLAEARQAIKARDAARKDKRDTNKKLRASLGIDPSKMPESMKPEEYAAAVKLLRAAIEPQFKGYKAEIFRALRGRVDYPLSLLAKANGDAIAAAFAPDSLDSLLELSRSKNEGWAVARHKLKAGEEMLSTIRKWTEPCCLPKGVSEYTARDTTRPGAIDLRLPKSDAVIDAELDKQAHQIALKDFDSYAAKLAGKIAQPVERATIIGHLWSNSVLVAHIEAGFWNESQRQPVQRWSTQMILNRSVLNTLFNQWPTRRIDKEAKQ